MRTRIMQWIFFGVLFSAIPLALVCFVYGYGTPNAQLEKQDYAPDLILVSFAITVNALGNAYGRDTKNEGIEEFCMGFSLLAMIVCCAYYFYLMGRSINLNEEFTKLAKIANENPELILDAIAEIKKGLDETINNIHWSLYINTSYAIAGISGLFGIIMEVKQSRKEKKNQTEAEGGKKEEEKKEGEDYEQLLSTFGQFLRDKKDNLPPEEYKELISKINEQIQNDT